MATLRRNYRLQNFSLNVLINFEGIKLTVFTKCTLDTSGNYFIELFDVSKPEYKTLIEPLIQNGVGSFLLTVGKAVIEDPKHKIMPNVELSIEGGEFSSEYYQIQVFDPKTKKLIYSGRMNTAMYNKDMGIDYY